MDERANPIDKTALACGGLSLALGLFVVLSASGLIPTRGSSENERWIGVIAGMLFVFGGAAVVIQTCARATSAGVLPSTAPRWVRGTLRLLSLAIVVSFGTIATWISIGPGERHFNGGIPFLPAWLNEPTGRTAFGICAVLIWGILILIAIMAVRSRGSKSYAGWGAGRASWP